MSRPGYGRFGLAGAVRYHHLDIEGASERPGGPVQELRLRGAEPAGPDGEPAGAPLEARVVAALAERFRDGDEGAEPFHRSLLLPVEVGLRPTHNGSARLVALVEVHRPRGQDALPR